ncbi:MAG TPA: ABC transporter substrate-binding protein [Tissierellia bacterium]|nr:ABC transporter substrate-binding protein [Tissierellia bacterium]
MKQTKLFLILLVLSLILVGCTKEPEVPQTSTPVEPVQQQEQVQEQEQEQEQNMSVSRDGVDYYDKFGVVQSEDTVTVVDSLDHEVTIPKQPKKVAILYNSYLSLWDLMGGDVVAVVEQADEKPVEGLDHAEVIGKPTDPNIEKILEIEPDFCVLTPVSANKELAARLNEMGIPTIYMEGRKKDDYYKVVRLFSALLEDESMFEKYALDIEEEIQQILAKVPEAEPQKILLMMSTAKGVTVRNNQSLNGEMLADLHTVNIADNAVSGDRSEVFSMEQIVQEDPDVIFVTEMGSDLEAIAQKRQEMLENDPVWGELSAVKNGRYHILPKDLFTYRPNQYYPEAYSILAKHLYPDIFGE